MRYRHLQGMVCFALYLCAAAMDGQRLALKDGDTVVFYGDSITAQPLYTRLVEEALLTRYPPMHVRFVNAEAPGDASYGGSAGTAAERVERDVAPLHPAMVAVMLGIKDGGSVSPSPVTEDAFRKGYTALLDALKQAAPNARLTLLLPTPYDDITHGTGFPGYAKTIDRLAADVVQIAAQRTIHGESGFMVVDLHQPMVDALERAKRDFPQLAPLLVPDRIHPSATAQWITAAVLLSAWDMNPVVSRLTISASETAVIGAEQTRISGLRKTATGMRWDELDEALPLPLDPEDAITTVLLRVSDIERLDQEPLRVIGLPVGSYQLLIDKRPIGTFSSAALERGINLALKKTPMLDQARGVDGKSERRPMSNRARFMPSAGTANAPDPVPDGKRIGMAPDELAEAIRKQAVPTPHEFELRRN